MRIGSRKRAKCELTMGKALPQQVFTPNPNSMAFAIGNNLIKLSFDLHEQESNNRR